MKEDIIGSINIDDISDVIRSMLEKEEYVVVEINGREYMFLKRSRENFDPPGPERNTGPL
jgi:hypothetical protein